MIVRRGALAALFCASILLASATSARAEPTPAEKKAAAQALFDEARKLTTDGKFAEACPKFIESERLDSTMGTKFYLADCFEHVGKIASAWAYYVEVTDAARTAGLKERETYAHEHAEALLPKLSRLTIQVSKEARGSASLSVTRDGLAVGEALWGTAVPVDPGVHVVTASASKKEPWEGRVEVKDPGQTVTIEVPALQDQAPDKGTAPPPPPPPPPLGGEPPARSGTGQRIAGIAVGAVGLVGIGVGAGMSGLAVSKRNASDADGHCDVKGFCDDTGLALRKDAVTAAKIATASFVVGAVALAGGVVLVLTAPRAAPKKSSLPVKATGQGPSLSGLVVGPGGLSMVGRW